MRTNEYPELFYYEVLSEFNTYKDKLLQKDQFMMMLKLNKHKEDIKNFMKEAIQSAQYDEAPNCDEGAELSAKI